MDGCFRVLRVTNQCVVARFQVAGIFFFKYWKFKDKEEKKDKLIGITLRLLSIVP